MAVIHVNFFSESLMKMVPFTAVIPNDCIEVPEQKNIQEDVSSSAGMKTLYLLHGYTGNENDYLTHSHIVQLCEEYQIAAIMPAGDNSFYIDDEDAKKCYGKYVGKELVEYTRKLFHLSEKYEDTYIGGLSMGGYGAIRNGFKYADTFSKIAAFSGAYLPIRIADTNGQAYIDKTSDEKQQTKIFGNLQEVPGSELDPRVLWKNQKEKGITMPKIFMAEGSEDFMLEVNHKLRDFLLEENADVTYVEDEGIHDWKFWNKHLEQAFQFLAE